MKSYFNDAVVVVSDEIAANVVVAVPLRCCTKTNASLLRVSSQSISIFSIFLRFASTPPPTSSSLWWFFICLVLKKWFIENQIRKKKWKKKKKDKKHFIVINMWFFLVGAQNKNFLKTHPTNFDRMFVKSDAS